MVFNDFCCQHYRIFKIPQVFIAVYDTLKLGHRAQFWAHVAFEGQLVPTPAFTHQFSAFSFQPSAFSMQPSAHSLRK